MKHTSMPLLRQTPCSDGGCHLSIRHRLHKLTQTLRQPRIQYRLALLLATLLACLLGWLQFQPSTHHLISGLASVASRL